MQSEIKGSWEQITGEWRKKLDSGGSTVQETQVWSLGREDPLEEEKATHSGILAWRVPWTEEPGGLQSMGSQKSWTQLSTHGGEIEIQGIYHWKAPPKWNKNAGLE